MLAPHISVVNLGCRVNRVESDRITADLMRLGFAMVEPPDADLIVINTCAVTGEAEAKTRKAVRHALAHPNEPYVLVTGCVVNLHPEELLELSDRVIAEPSKIDVAERVCEVLGVESDSVPACSDGEVVDALGRSRLGVKIQDGCNQFCTYCMIPYARGRIRSKKTEDVVGEVKRLAASGCQEVVLTGIHLSSYGIDTGESLLELIQKVHEIDGIKRIRLGSLEPRIITEEFASSIAALPKMCPHFHLSLQSGCNATLKRMNRRYSAEEYMEKCDLLRKYFHNPALTTDVIVGFPGETQEEFAESMDFVDRVNFYETHIFKYSRRAGTKAAVMPDQVPEEIKSERSAKMIELGHRKQKAYEEKLLGTTQEVLMEEAVETEDGIYQVGHTKEYVKIGLKTEENLSNQLKNVKIEDTKQIIH